MHKSPIAAKFRKITLYYSRDGLYINSSKEQPRYKVGGVKRKKLVNFLLQNTVLHRGKILMSMMSYSSYPLLSTEIKEINENFKKTLTIDEDLILSIPSRGYLLNPKFHIDRVT